MMKKRKCEQPEASSSLVSEDSAPEDERREQSLSPATDDEKRDTSLSPSTETDATDDVEPRNEHQQKKRKVSTLNFSIESIMSSSSPNAETPVASRVVASNSATRKMKTRLCPASISSCETPTQLIGFECQLDNKDIWEKFHPLDTEMIITKQGRRMFPPVRVTFSIGLAAEQALLAQNPRDKYQVLMDILPYDGKRYRYAYHKSSWQQAGKADPPSPTKLFLHPDGPFTLEQLKRQVISFEKIKLTNNDANKHGYIVLNSMHKYQPRIHLVLWRGKESQSLANAPISQLEQELHKSFIFSETIFTAVTAYQNHSITKLKIDSNPFAKGFRDSSRLTDLELESMQDLMSEGQCPFSPPRAPPHGFPHFLFAAAQQAAAAAAGAGSLEDPASTLLRERTIMALDSFLQQQQQQQQQQHIQSTSPNRPGPPPYSQAAATNVQQSQHQQLATSHPPPYPGIPFTNFLSTQQPTQQTKAAPPAGAPQQVPANLEQLIMQQQQQFAAAAAMAAAAAAHNHPLHSLFTAASGGQHLTNKQQQQPSGKLSGNRAGNQSCSPIQLSPNFAPATTKSPTTTAQNNHHQQHHPHNGRHSPSFQLNGLAQGGAQSTGAAHYAFHPQHLQAMMAAHHQHQMAAQMAQMHQQLEQSAAAAAVAANRQLVVGLPHINQESGNQLHHLHHQQHQQQQQQHLQLAGSAGIGVATGNMSEPVQVGKKNL